VTQKPVRNESRTPEQLREHYEIEKELASRLRDASRQERRHLYSSVYDELYRRVTHHPQLTRKTSPEQRAAAVSKQMNILSRFLDKECTFLEVGPGDCALSLEVSKLAKQVYSVDVSDEITKGLTPPQNFRLILSDGCSIPVPPNSVNVAYSNQLMEHLHPDDAFEQLQNIYHALIPGGVYICITPNRLGGPHDISKHFDTVATGFHLKEYTVSELSHSFQQVGFSKVSIAGAKGIWTNIPVFPAVLCERLLCALPYSFRKSIAGSLPFPVLLVIRLIGIK